MENNSSEFKNVIDYYILPVHKHVKFELIEDRSEFDAIILKYEGKPTEDLYKGLKKDNAFVRAFPLFGYHKERSFYLLINGLLAVDQSELNKANPYYICDSFESHKLIAQYLHIHYIDLFPGPIIQCHLHEHFLIKKFLDTGNLDFIEEKSDEAFKFFLAKEGKCVYVRYNKNKKNTSTSVVKRMRSFFIKSKQNEEETYYSLNIYESIEIMNLLGVFDHDD